MTKDNEELYTALQMQMQSFQTQIDDLKDTVHSVDEKQDKICTLASDINVARNDIKHLQLGQDDLEKKQEDIQQQVDTLQKQPYDEYKRNKNQIKTTVISRLLGDGISALLGALILLMALVSSGKIHI